MRFPRAAAVFLLLAAAAPAVAGEAPAHRVLIELFTSQG
jgi:hypothetical protein